MGQQHDIIPRHFDHLPAFLSPSLCASRCRDARDIRSNASDGEACASPQQPKARSSNHSGHDGSRRVILPVFAMLIAGIQKAAQSREGRVDNATNARDDFSRSCCEFADLLLDSSTQPTCYGNRRCRGTCSRRKGKRREIVGAM